MATVANQMQQDPNAQQQGSQGQIMTPGTAMGAPTGPGGASSSTPGSTPGAAPVSYDNQTYTPTSSGSFQNLQKYINANQGFNAGQGGLAGEVAGNINQQGQQTQSEIQGMQNAFNTQAQNNVNNFTQATNSSNGQPSLLSQATANAGQFMQNNPTGAQSILNAENAQYTGPTQLQNQGQLQTQAQNVQNQAQQAQTENGRYSLLQQMFGSPTYTQGQQNLDQAIMQNAPGAQQQFAGLTNMGNATQNAYTNAQNQVAQQVNQNQQLAAQTAAQTQGQLNSAVMANQNAVQQQLTGAQSAAQTGLTQLQADLTSGNLTAADYAALGGANSGLTSGMSLYGMTPAQLSQYVTAGTAPTAQTVATANQYANFSALNQLLGGGGGGSIAPMANTQASNILSQYINPSQAGTYTGPSYNWNSGGLQQALNTDQGNYQAAINALNSAINTQDQQYANQISGYQNQMHNLGNIGSLGYLQGMINNTVQNAQDYDKAEAAALAAAQANTGQVLNIGS